jgi:hypothetical protein
MTTRKSHLKSKRFWLNVVTAVTMLGAVATTVELSAKETKILTLSVAVANIILQVFFNSNKK